MNKILSIVLVFFFSAASAQPTLTATSNNPIVGDTFYEHYVDNSQLYIPVTGAGVTWDYSILTTVSTFAIDYRNTGTYCSSIPAANIVAYEVGSAACCLADNGRYAIMYNAIPYPDTLEYVRYPMSYGSTFRDAKTNISGTDTFIYIRNAKAEGYGSLHNPAGIFNNTLLIHNVDSQLVMSVTGLSGVIRDEYRWYTPGIHTILMGILAETVINGSQIISAGGYTMVSNVGIAGQSKPDIAFSLSPNPAQKNTVIRLSVTVEDNSVCYIEILDFTGRLVTNTILQGVKAGINNIGFPADGLDAGVYIVHLSAGNKHAYSKIVIY